MATHCRPDPDLSDCHKQCLPKSPYVNKIVVSSQRGLPHKRSGDICLPYPIFFCKLARKYVAIPHFPHSYPIHRTPYFYQLEHQLFARKSRDALHLQLAAQQNSSFSHSPLYPLSHYHTTLYSLALSGTPNRCQKMTLCCQQNLSCSRSFVLVVTRDKVVCVCKEVQAVFN